MYFFKHLRIDASDSYDEKEKKKNGMQCTICVFKLSAKAS